MSLKIWGVYFKHTPKCSPNNTSKFAGFTLWKIYSTTILIILWLNVTRAVIVFKDRIIDIPNLFLKFITTSWMTLIACNASVCYYACASPQCLPAFLDQLNQIWSDYETSDSVGYIRKKAWFYTMFSWKMIIGNMVFCSYALYKTNNFDMVLLPFHKEMPGFDIGKFS